MSEPFEDVSHWPVSRYVREVVAAQPDGRVLLAFGKLNIVVGCLLAMWLVISAPGSNLGGVHVVLLLGLPLVGFVWFLKDMPSPRLTAFEHIMREPWQRKISVGLQLVVGLAPWAAIVEAFLR
ncbi:hypothetical protein [Hydrogenophaga sp. NFH-34]|uniref:hypothetical protein n=1 Tax=Hydrogenophaga sp. NFH-34 TaxID=2744446 RepID=UPI001F1B1125|nr:hypothetical protein [Hydrogenophaga sp. NFH-34]